MAKIHNNVEQGSGECRWCGWCGDDLDTQDHRRKYCSPWCQSDHARSVQMERLLARFDADKELSSGQLAIILPTIRRLRSPRSTPRFWAGKHK